MVKFELKEVGAADLVRVVRALQENPLGSAALVVLLFIIGGFGCLAIYLLHR